LANLKFKYFVTFNRRLVLSLLGVTAIALSPSPAFTQIPVIPPPLPQNLPKPLPSPDELLKIPSQTPQPTQTEPDDTGAIAIKRFEVIGSTVFSPDELNAVLAEFANRSLTFAELIQARSAITDLYIRKGYITSGAYIPPQDLSSGIVQIQVVEGGLQEIKVTGTERLSPDYIRSRINIATGAPLNRERLIEALQVLQINPLIASLSAELSAGDRVGQNTLELTVKEAETFDLQLSIDNNRSPSVGSLRRRIQASEANLTGLGDSLTISYGNTDGSNTYDLNYNLPVNPYNGSISLALSLSNSNVIESPFDALNIYSTSNSYDLTFRQPVIQTPSQDLAFGVVASYRESSSSLLGIPFPLSPGANDQGVTKISILSLFQEYTQRSSQSVLSFRNQLNIGLGGVFGSTVNVSPPDSRFVAFRGQAQYVGLLAPETVMLLRGDLQLSDRALVPLQQISVGGQDSLRGYRQDLLLGDNGAFFTAEMRIPIARIPEIEGLLQIAPFLDSGMVWTSSSDSNPDPNFLIGTGLGLRWQMGNRMTALLNYGIPLMNVQNSRKTWQENGIYFSLTYNLF